MRIVANDDLVASVALDPTHVATLRSSYRAETCCVGAARPTPLSLQQRLAARKHHVIPLAYRTHLFFPGVYPDQMSLRNVRVLVLPGVDAISDEQSSGISVWVRGGGHLVLWGNASATLDAELRPRSSPAFCDVCAHCPGCTNASASSGLGSVTHVATAVVQAAMSTDNPSARQVLLQVNVSCLQDFH